MTFAVLTARAIPLNILAYIQSDQDSYLETGLKAIKNVSQTVANRSVPYYPSIAFSDDNDAKDYSGDVIQAAYSATFEISVTSNDPDDAVTQARKYAAGVESMILNCPTLTTNTGATSASIQTLESGFDPIKTNDQQSEFLQVFQIRATWLLTAGAYE